MKLSHMMLTAALLSSAAFAFTALAQGSGDDKQRHASEKAQQRRGGGLQHLLAGVELTDAQKQQIKQLTEQHLAKAKADTSAGRSQMHELMAAESFDELNAKQLIQLRQEQKLQRQLQRLQLQHQILQLLSAEQRDQVNANLAKPPKGRFAPKHG